MDACPTSKSLRERDAAIAIALQSLSRNRTNRYVVWQTAVRRSKVCSTQRANMEVSRSSLPYLALQVYVGNHIEQHRCPFDTIIRLGTIILTPLGITYADEDAPATGPHKLVPSADPLICFC